MKESNKTKFWKSSSNLCSPLPSIGMKQELESESKSESGKRTEISSEDHS